MKFILIAVALLAGCASMPAGIAANPEELEACKQESCSVWTPNELQQLFKAGFLRGLLAGRGKQS